MPLPLIPIDKANHVVYGSATYLTAAFLSAWLGPLVGLSISPRHVGIVASVIVGAGKEAADGYRNWRITGDPRQGPHGFELLDFVATVSGGLICLVASALH